MSGGWGTEHVSVRFGPTAALDDVTWRLSRGAVRAVVGPDGAGKSTLLRVLAGLVSASSGTVRRPPRREMGFVPARGGVFAELTVAENLAFVAAAYGIASTAAVRRRDELTQWTGLAPALHRRAAHLSGGMARKLAFAMAVLAEPLLLVLDEPTTGVDPVSRAEIWRLVAATAASGTAVAMSTTYLDEAERAESVLVLDGGKEVLAGAPADIVAAAPGAVRWSESPPPGFDAWRVGGRWKVWDPGAAPGRGDAALSLEDAVIVAELSRAQAVPS